MKTKLLLASMAALALLSASPLLAHHGTGISYDLQHDPIGPIRPEPLTDVGGWLRDHESR